MDKWLKSQRGDMLVRANDIVSIGERKNAFINDVFDVLVLIRGFDRGTVMGKYPEEADALLVVKLVGEFLKETDTNIEYQLPPRDFY